jgi:hypothetical protein
MELVPLLDKWIKGGVEEGYFIARVPQMTKVNDFLFAPLSVRSRSQRRFIVHRHNT